MLSASWLEWKPRALCRHPARQKFRRLSFRLRQNGWGVFICCGIVGNLGIVDSDAYALSVIAFTVLFWNTIPHMQPFI
jgi:hypothetical protein